MTLNPAKNNNNNEENALTKILSNIREKINGKNQLIDSAPKNMSMLTKIKAAIFGVIALMINFIFFI
jgi:hypothetical protein